MKRLLTLMLLGCSAPAWTQAVYRCADQQGTLVLQDHLCLEPFSTHDTQQATMSARYAPVEPGLLRLLERQQRDVLAATADNLRVQQLLQKSGESETHQYEENRQRCESARKIAMLCGKSVEGLSCDERGFQQRRSVPGNINGSSRARYSADQCALRATMGGH